ncbi:MAG: 2OG-Fe(II) oxygenase, partial [Gammaproteobacteria bacterium]|nr:2OG-Fe(II) oxygenase [Gammaproteobacteria bacterium]
MASTVGGDTDSTAAVWQAGGLPVALDWQPLLERLDEHGVARTPPMLSPQQCEALIALYAEDERFRSHIVMQRHGFGQGEYRYLRYPLPALVQSLREQVYARLQPLANAWYQRMHGDTPY